MTHLRHVITAVATLLTLTLGTQAANRITTVTQVSTAVTLSNDVDYHITGTEPFTATGSVNIINTDHAVIIFDNLKPSLALKQLGHITINGAAAVSETNCQVRIYNRGAILFPYGKESAAATGFHPLTVYSEKDCSGDACELFGLENSGGYMNSLTAQKLNNRIRSFRLKRGYMVTFSLRAAGRGYSRCFIADKEDLVLNSLPTLLDSRISSYRIFRWYYTGKAALANDTGYGSTQALNVTSCYSFSKGESRLPDAECVPHHIYENWPGAADLGNQSYSCHLKTNNEPRNASDPTPNTLPEILANWEDLMRTGLRLCTPSSWDGSDYWNATGFLAEFLDSIDARGWRCDIIDLHGYWNEGSFSSNPTNWASKFQRPVWISEWVWGSSWGPAGIFASANWDNPTATDLRNNRDAVQRITNTLNNNNAVERYFYWNSERNCSKIYMNGALTPAGEYYASINSGVGYTGYGNYIPKAPPYTPPSGLTVTNNLKKGINTVKWSNPAGDLTDTLVLQRRINNAGTWVAIASWGSDDKEDYEYNDTISEPGLYSYRLRLKGYNSNSWQSTSDESVTVGGSYNIGDIMYGRMQINNDQASTTSFTQQETSPYVIVGIPTRKNTRAILVSQVTTVAKDNFKFIYRPWTEGTSSAEISNTETSDFIVMQPGNYTWGSMKAEVGTYHKEGAEQTMLGATEVEVTFNQPFDEGVTPVVMAQLQGSVTTGAVLTTHVYDVTNTGFKLKLQAQQANTLNVRTMYVRYIAVTPGQARIEKYNKLISAGFGNTPVGGSTTGQLITFLNPEGDTLRLVNPYVIIGAQTHNLDYACVYRNYRDETVSVTDEDGNTTTRQTGLRVLRQMDPSVKYETGANKADVDGDNIGWLTISDDLDGTNALHPVLAPRTFYVRVTGGAIIPSDATARIYSTTGAQVAAGTRLPAGIYVVSNGSQSLKVLVK